MGFAITWCAVREQAAAWLLEQLGLSPNGDSEQFPESLISSAKLDTGWRVLWYNECGCPFLQPEDVQRLSAEHDVLVCFVEEHVMFSSAELWVGGKRKWLISYEGERRPKRMTAEGALPASFVSIRNEMDAAQRGEGADSANVDYVFDVPLLVAQSLVGFKHDEECPHMVGQQFEVLTKH